MITRNAFLGLAAAAALMLVAGPLSAQSQPSATLTAEIRSVAVGIGTSSGTGELTLNDGTKRFFSLTGLSVIDVGVSRSSVVGQVYNLQNVEDFAGAYTAGTAGIAIGGGAGTASMTNEKGVTITASSSQTGLRLTLAPTGVTIRLAPSVLQK